MCLFLSLCVTAGADVLLWRKDKEACWCVIVQLYEERGRWL